MSGSSQSAQRGKAFSRRGTSHREKSSSAGIRRYSHHRKRLPYRITNRVLEFDANRLIAWCDVGRHRWRWELEAVEGGTRVRETFDYSTARIPKVIELIGAPGRNRKAIEATLDRLSQHFSERRAPT